MKSGSTARSATTVPSAASDAVDSPIPVMPASVSTSTRTTAQP